MNGGLSRGAIAIALLVGVSAPALAQEPRQSAENTSAATNTAGAATTPGSSTADIVVTANKRAESIQRVATSVTAISGSDLAQQGRRRIEDVLQGVPGVKVQTVSTGFAVAVRGIGVETTAGIGDPGVATNIDEVYTDIPEAGRVAFYDINRVEVLRGPQGTLYGRNSTAGVLNVVSNDPVFESEGALSLGIGNYRGFDANVMANVLLNDQVAIRGAFYKFKHDGYLNNGQQDADDLGARVKLLVKPTDRISVLVGGEYGEVTGNGTTGAIPFDRCSGSECFRTTNGTGNLFTFKNQKVWTRIEADLGFATFTAIPSYQRFNSRLASNLGIFFIRYNTQETQKAGELRLSSPAGSAVEWQVGGFLYDSDRPTVTTSPINQTQASRTKSIAGFADVTVPLGDILKVNVGIRQTQDKKDIQIDQVLAGVASSAALNRKFSRFDYKVNLQAQITPDSLLFAKVSTGFRSGGLYGTAPSNSFEPEKVTAYEVGSKNRFLDGRLVVNLGAFYYDYSNFQATNVIFVGGAPVQAVINAPGAKNYGGELETSYALTAADRLNLTVAYLHARFADGFVFQGVNYSDRPLGHAPEWHLTGAYQHVFDLGSAGTLTARGDTTYESRSSTTFLFQPLAIQHAYWQSNAQITYQPSPQITVTGYIRNIENVAVKGQYQSQGPTIVLLPPRTYGVRAAFTF